MSGGGEPGGEGPVCQHLLEADPEADLCSLSSVCTGDHPRPREWRGEQQEDREARIQHSTSIVAAVVLALLGVCVLLFSVGSVLVRLRSGEEEEAPDLPYSPPVKRALVTESQSEALTAQPRVITIIEGRKSTRKLT